MPEPESPPCPPAPADIVNVRSLAASRDQVFAAFADPAKLARWWGPLGFTNEFHVFEFRPGGVWRFTMRGPDGASYAMDHRFVEILERERIVVRHLQSGHDFTLTVTLVPRGNATEIHWCMRFDDPAEATRLRGFLETANEENLCRLAGELALQP